MSRSRAQYRQIMLTGILLFLFAAIGTAMVAFTYEQSREQIAENERQVLMDQLNAVLNPERYDNDPLEDAIQVQAPNLLGTPQPVTVYRARIQGVPVAAIFTPVAPDGYNGRIRLLVGVDVNGVITGVRVLSHRETPGLGDAIEAGRSDWIRGFAGRSLNNPAEQNWAVKKDGGVFDQFTGATITPRAVVEAVRKTLIYFRRHRSEIFRKPGDASIEKMDELINE